MYPGMSFPLLVNKEKIGIFKVLGTLPMTTGQITSGTKIMIWKGSDEKTVGETLYPPILHPVIATPLQMKMVDDPALSNVVGRASKMIGNFMSYYTHLPHEATKGKMTFLLHGPCDKKAVVEGIGRTLGLPVASVDASSLIKDFPSDSVSQINTCIQRPESRDGPLLIFLDRFDELVPHNRCGSTVMTDITTTQVLTTRISLSITFRESCLTSHVVTRCATLYARMDDLYTYAFFFFFFFLRNHRTC
jgi:hypothetical protein